MFCQNCGSLLPENAKVCPECGTPVSTEAAGGAAPESYVASQPQPVPQPQPAPQPQPTPQPVYQQPQPAYQQPQPQPTYQQPQPAYRQPQPGPAYQAGQPQLRSIGLAITALIMSIASIVCCCVPYIQIPLAIVGLILGILGIRSRLKAMAIISVIISSLSLVFGIIMLIILLISPDSITYTYDFYEGDIGKWFENFFR